MTRPAGRLLLTALLTATAIAPPTAAETGDNGRRLSSSTFAGLKLRGIGPALMSGRIADIAIHPASRSTWYVAAGSGGVWKTTNAGRVRSIVFGHWNSRGGPTATHHRELEVATEAYERLAQRLRDLIESELPEIERALEQAGAPWTPGRRPLP